MMPKLLERAGNAKKGGITGLYTVLVEGDDMNEPVADAVRGILDGHCVLSRELAHRNHYPAIDVLQSVSRLAPSLVDSEILEAAGNLRESLALYRANEDLITVGAYAPGSDARIDAAIQLQPAIEGFLRQRLDEAIEAGAADAALTRLLEAAEPPRGL
jgi:flagellum-specific ATP synthase